MGQVLIVEDYPPLATVLSLALGRLGHGVAKANSVRRARTLSGPFEVGIIDIDLPDGSGVRLAEELLANGRVGRVVFYSASREERALADAARLGVVISKDAGLDPLLRVVHEFWEATHLPPAKVANGAGGEPPSSSSGTRPRFR